MAIEVAQIVQPKPSIHLDSKTLKQIKDWKVGKTYHIDLTVRLKEQHEEYDDKSVIGAQFEVVKAKECDCDD